MSRARQFIGAFLLTAAGIAAATAIVWHAESRLISRAVSLPVGAR